MITGNEPLLKVQKKKVACHACGKDFNRNNTLSYRCPKCQRKVNIEKSRKHNKDKYHSDEKHRAHVIKHNCDYQKKKYATDPAFRKARNEYVRKWRLANVVTK